MSTDSLNDLISAAQAVIDRWDSPSWKDLPATADYIHRLRKAVAEAKPSEICDDEPLRVQRRDVPESEIIRSVMEIRNSIFYWMTRNVHTPEGAVQVLGQVKESLTEIISNWTPPEPVSNAVGDKLSPVEQSDVVGRWKSLTDSLEKKVPAAKQPVQQPPWKDMASGYYYLDAGSLTGPCQVEPIKRV